MAQLADLIQQAKLKELAQNEVRLARQLAAPAAELDVETRRQLVQFVQWTADMGVRYCPAAPTTVGAFIIAQSASGITEKVILTQIAAIEQMHDSVGMPSPVATTAARFALQQVVRAEPPRSWTKPEKLLWAQLPPEIRAVIRRRDADQEREMRRAQNEAGDLRAELRQMAEAATTADNSTTEGNTMAKKTKGLGAYTTNEDPIEKREGHVDSKGGKDIRRTVFSNGDRTDGFAAKLTPTKE